MMVMVPCSFDIQLSELNCWAMDVPMNSAMQATAISLVQQMFFKGVCFMLVLIDSTNSLLAYQLSNDVPFRFFTSLKKLENLNFYLTILAVSQARTFILAASNKRS